MDKAKGLIRTGRVQSPPPAKQEKPDYDQESQASEIGLPVVTQGLRIRSIRPRLKSIKSRMPRRSIEHGLDV